MMTPASPTSSFNDELKDFLLSELDDLGEDALSAGLEGALMAANGEIVATGVTEEMRDGNAASVLAAADMVALALGHGRAGEDPEIVSALAPYTDALRAEDGLADLALQALSVLSNPDVAKFAGCKGIFDSVAKMQAQIEDVTERVKAAKFDYPGTWDHVAVAPGTFKVTMYPDAAEDDANDG